MAVVTPWAGNFAPANWLFCKGQQMSIAENSALFALIGTTYGGDGVQNFNLPDLQSRTVVGAGQGPGTGSYTLGQKGGTETNTINLQQMAAHTHPFVLTSQMPVNGDGGSTKNPQGAYPAPGSGNIYSTSGAAGQQYGALNVVSQITTAGGGQPVNNIQPVLCVNYIICVEGIFPSRP